MPKVGCAQHAVHFKISAGEVGRPIGLVFHRTLCHGSTSFQTFTIKSRRTRFACNCVSEAQVDGRLRMPGAVSFLRITSHTGLQELEVN